MKRRTFLALALAAAPSAALASAKAEKKKGGGLSFLQLQAVAATIVRPNGRRGVMTVETGLDIPDSALRERADASAPRLRAAFVQVVQTYASGLQPGSPPNLDFLARELQREADRVLGRKGARVLLGSVLVN